MELGFMKSQRDKVGDRGSMQIGSKDVIETKKQARYLERKDYSSNPKRAKTNMGESSTTSGLDILDENEPLDESDNEGSDLSVDLSSTRDYTQNDVLDISKISLAAIMFDVSNRATAAISTATVAALKNVNLISEDVEIIIDHNKIRRSKHKVMKEQQMVNEQAIEASTIQGILFDGRKDTTKFMRLGWMVNSIQVKRKRNIFLFVLNQEVDICVILKLILMRDQVIRLQLIKQLH